MDKALNLCRPLHKDCQLSKFMYGPPSSEKLAWASAHPLCIKNMPQDIAFKRMKDVSAASYFEPTNVDSITEDPEEWGRLHKERSDNSGVAAASRRHARACSGCLCDLSDQGNWCWRRGGKNCGGPYYKEDFRHWSDACEPWMMHVLTLSGQGYDMREDVPKWTGSHRGGFIVGYPLRKDSGGEKGRFVCVFKLREYELSWATLPYKQVCKRLKVKTVQTWKDIAGDGKIDWRKNHTLRSLAFLLASGSVRSHSQRVHFGWCDYHLYKVSLDRGCGNAEVHFRSDRARIYPISVDKVSDLFRLSGIRFDSAKFSKKRVAENAGYKALLHEHRVLLPVQRWRELYARSKGNPPTPQEIRKMLARERRKAAKARKAEREVQAAKEALKSEPEVVVAPEAVGVVD
jgi:hypothetical protein